MLPIKILHNDDNTLWAKASNDCDKTLVRSGVNHVWIKWYQTNKYFKMGLAKDGGPGQGGASEIILNVKDVDVKDKIKIVGTDYEPKIQIKYYRDGNLCTVTLEPCDESKRTKQYKDCLTPGLGFQSQKEWVESVRDWFNFKIDISKVDKSKVKQKSTTTPSTPVTDADVDKFIEQQTKITEEQQLKDKSKTVENRQISALTQQSQHINELSSKEEKEADQHLAEAKKLLNEHENLMKQQDEILNKGLTHETTKIGGKKSRKKRRTKRRKSIRRKKAKKTKKH
jgi:hypothetical protein